MNLYEPTDIDAANEQWGANCGPCSLAAVLGKEVASVKDLFFDFDKRRYVNPTHMQAALRIVGKKFNAIKTIPVYGLAFIQITGTWTKPGIPIGAAYHHTHWVGMAQPMPLVPFFYDVNIEGGQWVEKTWWEENVLPLIVQSKKGADGKYFIRTALEIVS